MTLTIQAHAKRSMDMVPHIATLTGLAAGHTSIVEFGIRTGVSTWALLDGMAVNGHLTSVDKAVVDVPQRVSEDPRWTCIVGDDRDPKVQRQLGGATLVFIDTSHEYHHTLEELALAAQLGAERIVLHDWSLADIQDAVAGFVQRSPYRIEGIEPSQWGMAWLSRS